MLFTDFRVVLRDVAFDEGSQIQGMGMGGRAGARDTLSGARWLLGSPQCLQSRLGKRRRSTELLLCWNTQGMMETSYTYHVRAYVFNTSVKSYFYIFKFQYLYLLFSDDDLISLDEWVFNSEAHVLPIRGKNPYYRPAPIL